jgi:hypothetical protein
MINVPILTYTELQSDIRWHLHSWRASAFKFSGNLGNDSERIVRERGESHLDRPLHTSRSVVAHRRSVYRCRKRV